MQGIIIYHYCLKIIHKECTMQSIYGAKWPQIASLFGPSQLLMSKCIKSLLLLFTHFSQLKTKPK